MRSFDGETTVLDPIERASRDEIRALQLQRLQWALRHCYEHVPDYRRRFDEAGVQPDDCRSLDDLARFPFTTKEDLRRTYPFGMFAVPRDQVSRLHASSGTTGRPTVVGYTEGDIDTWSGLMARSIHAAGGRRGDIVHVAYGYGLFTGGLGAHYGAERLGCTVVPVSGGMTERQVQLIADLQPRVIMVTPSYLLAIVDEMERQGVDPRTTSLRVGILGAEPWTEDMRREIERRTAMSAVDIYGLSEVMGPGVAVECAETKDGLHVWEDHFLPEIVDPQTGDVLSDGERGELVFTSLTKEALPVVRYRTRDLTRLLPGTARTMRRMERITGRTDDMIILRGVNVFPTQVEELILRTGGLTPHFQLVLARPRRLDEMTVVVEARADATGDAAAMGGRLAASIKERIGVTV
ncbi:MAG: phenylacetate--CoA ligase, partial [Candidatus Dormibacteraeota bacterium]|nr:phenylacetate--CoA ligase [Candidatus Dormibacteraeota bacterium]